MNLPKSWAGLSCAAVLLLAFVLPAVGQDNGQGYQDNAYDNRGNDDRGNNDRDQAQGYDDPRNDPPGRVARMNFSQGSVSFQPGGEGDWVEAVPNRPMTTGDNLWSDRNSRGELHIGSTAVRIGGETSLTFLDLDDRTVQLRLAQGSLLLNVRHLDDNDTVEVDTPNLSFQVQYSGEYRIDVDPDGRATVIDVFHGRGQALGGGHNYTIVADQRARFTGGSEQDDQPLSYEVDRLPRDDDFDRWAWDRDHREDQSESASYVSREMTGYEDLDAYGRWSYDASYGHVWIPTRVESGWAPYREGHWAFIAPWGWTWVDDAPWGFAPFHYGRWCRVRETWAWIPGPVVVRPVYAPALVAFVGGGGFHLSVGFGGGGGVAWFPLGPGEVFVPAYHVSRAYVNQVNVTNTVVNVTKVTNVYNTTIVNNRTTVINNNNVNITKIVYVNQTAPNAVTAVSRETFVNARPVARNVVQVSQHDVEQAQVTRMTGVDPVRTSVMGSGRPTRVAPPAAVVTRQVVAQRAPTPPPVPFAQRQDPLVAHPTPQQPNRPGNPPVATQPVPIHPVPHDLPPNPVRPISEVPRPPQPGTGNSAGPGGQPMPPHQLPPNPARPAQDMPPAHANQPQQPMPPHDLPTHALPPHDLPPNPARGGQDAPRPPQEWNHPLVKPAAPPQPKSPQQGQDEERKFQNWQQKQRPPAPRPPAQQQEHRPADHKDEKHNR